MQSITSSLPTTLTIYSALVTQETLRDGTLVTDTVLVVHNTGFIQLLAIFLCQINELWTCGTSSKTLNDDW